MKRQALFTWKNRKNAVCHFIYFSSIICVLFQAIDLPLDVAAILGNVRSQRYVENTREFLM